MVTKHWSIKDGVIMGITFDEELYNLIRESALKNERNFQQEVRYILKKHYDKTNNLH